MTYNIYTNIMNNSKEQVKVSNQEVTKFFKCQYVFVPSALKVVQLKQFSGTN